MQRYVITDGVKGSVELILMSPSGNGRKSLAFRRRLQFERVGIFVRCNTIERPPIAFMI